MQVIIMAAGQGSRMKPLTNNTHKSLLPLNNHETFLSRILHQLNEYEIDKVVIVTGYKSSDIKNILNQFQLNTEVVFNDKYEVDTNIYSMKLALDNINQDEPVIILEADIYLDDLALRDIIHESQKNNSIWFTKNKFNNTQYGGILLCNENNVISDIQIVPKYKDKYKNYFKLLGIMTIGSNEIPIFKKYIDQYVLDTLEQYYLIPWIENLEHLPCYSYDLSDYLVESVNKPEEYESFKNFLENDLFDEKEISLINIDLLHDIEEHIIDRKIMLKNKILKEGIWTKPIIVERKNNLVLDGHHRFNLAKEINIKKIPAILVDYDDIKIWSLKRSQKVTKELIILKSLNKNIYPNKTVKHKFEFKIPNCSYKLEELK